MGARLCVGLHGSPADTCFMRSRAPLCLCGKLHTCGKSDSLMQSFMLAVYFGLYHYFSPFSTFGE